MKETVLITDEARRADLDRLWRLVCRLRDETQYRSVTFTLQNWMLANDGQNLKHGINQNLDITDLLFRVPEMPNTATLIDFMGKAGIDVNTGWPAILSFTVDVEYTKVN